jgi:hypothetical protein
MARRRNIPAMAPTTISRAIEFSEKSAGRRACGLVVSVGVAEGEHRPPADAAVDAGRHLRRPVP